MIDAAIFHCIKVSKLHCEREKKIAAFTHSLILFLWNLTGPNNLHEQSKIRNEGNVYLPLVCKRNITLTKKASEWRSWNRICNDSYKTFNLSDKIYKILFCLNEFFGLSNIKGVRTNGEKNKKK